jgi:hypothetical protein
MNSASVPARDRFRVRASPLAIDNQLLSHSAPPNTTSFIFFCFILFYFNIRAGIL